MWHKAYVTEVFIPPDRLFGRIALIETIHFSILFPKFSDGLAEKF
jgi:hypothetical protein